MPDSKITALASTGTGTDPANDPLVIVDVSDTSMAASGTTKKVTLNNLLACSPTATLASATITGDLTVRTTGFTVNSSGVGIGTSSQSSFLGNSPKKLVIGDGTQTPALTLYGGSANVSGIYYAKGTVGNQTYRGFFEYDHNVDALAFGIAGSTAMTLNSTGLGVGVVPSAGRLHIKGGSSQNPLVLDTLGYNQIVLQLNGANRGQIYADATNCLALVDSTGSNLRLVVTDTGNVGVGVSTFGTSAAKVLGLANATAPSTSPAGMGQLYVESGALKFRGSSGTITTIAAA